jgi:hypothetical protein
MLVFAATYTSALGRDLASVRLLTYAVRLVINVTVQITWVKWEVSFFSISRHAVGGKTRFGGGWEFFSSLPSPDRL